MAGFELGPRDAVAVAVFEDHARGDDALSRLANAGFAAERCSFVGKDHHADDHVIAFYTNGDALKVWGRQGARWGSVARRTRGAAFLYVPGVGPVLVFGPLGGWIMAAMEGAAIVGGVSALGAGLASLGVPEDAIGRYEQAVKGGRVLVLAHGTADQVDRARDVLRAARPAEAGAFHRLAAAV